ncbi:beta-lactamase/transpeptidase-like protein [Trichoderma compactum]
MHFTCSIVIFLHAFWLTPIFADTLGPSYPMPTDLTSCHSLVAASFRKLTSTLDTYLKDGKWKTLSRPLAGITNVSFSLGLFSLHDPAATGLQYHYTSPEIANAPNGTHKVDENTIYRVASVTKVFTVLTGLLELNDSDWNRPLTEILSSLKKFIAGVPRDGFPDTNDLAFQTIIQSLAGVPLNPDPVKLGLPPISRNNTFVYSPCLFSNTSNCPPVPYIESSEARAPSFLPYTTPGYANNGFSLLGLAIENITGKSFETMFHEDIFGPLDMTSSSAITPPKSEWHRSVIPGDISNFDIESGVYITSGAVLSTINDMAKLGVAILNSTLLPSDQTRRWLKPFSHTADLRQSVGRPWEIHRYTHPSGVITNLYTKSGDSGDYSAYFVLLPDYDAGFTILSSSSQVTRFLTLSALMDIIINSVIPSLAAQAAAEAEHRFAGFYDSENCSLNSSLTLAVNQSTAAAPGLVISSWISNGTDVLKSLAPTTGPGSWRLLPSISDFAHGKVAFRFVTDLDAPKISSATENKLFTDFPSADWVSVDATAYGGIATTLFIFDVAEDGTVNAVSPSALQVELTKEHK